MTLSHFRLIAILIVIFELSGAATIIRTPLFAEKDLSATRLIVSAQLWGKRYFQEPIGSASTIYATVLTIGNQDFRVIMVLCYIGGRNVVTKSGHSIESSSRICSGYYQVLRSAADLIPRLCDSPRILAVEAST